MPRRLARSTVATSTPRNARNKNRKRQLDAYAIAGKTAPEKNKIRGNRLGEVLDDGPKTKRRRVENDEEGDDSNASEQDGPPSKRRQNDQSRKDEDEDVEYGSDSEGNEWTTGGLADDDDDESLDSDEAFGESDEERFEGFTFRGSRSNGNKKRGQGKQRASRSKDNETELDLVEHKELDNDDEDEEEDDFGDEGVDLATMLDDEHEETSGAKDRIARDLNDGSESDESEDYNSDNDSEEFSEEEEEEEEDDDENDDHHARLQDFVDALDQGSKSTAATANTEDDYGGLTLDDLLDETVLDKDTLATLKPKRKSKAPQLVSAPLPKRQQDRIDRELASQKAKEQLDRWQDTVIQNRRAEFLSFPLRDPDQAEPVGKERFTPAQQSETRTALEADIQRIMEESGMASRPDGKGGIEDGEDDLLKAEELATNNMPVEEVLRRRADLRRARELLFRDEIKAKRIAKIKSKAYRRVHRKERERLADKERMLLDPEGFANGELNEDEKELADRRRAEARMGAKHKDSKWARSLRATDRTVWDTDAREGAIEQARRHEELKRRMTGKDIDEEESDNFTDDGTDEDGNTLQQLKRLNELDGKGEEKGLSNMKFMSTAAARQKAENDEAVDQLRRELSDAADDESEKENEGLGRAIFGPGPKEEQKRLPKAKKPVLEESTLTDEEDESFYNGAKSVVPPTQNADRNIPNQLKSILKNGSKATRPLSKSTHLDKNASSDTRENSRPEELSAWLSAPREKRSKLDKKLARSSGEDTFIDTHISEVQAPASSPGKPDRSRTKGDSVAAISAQAGGTNGWTVVRQDQDEDDSASDGATETPMLSQAERNASFHARAFAGDDVALQFSTEKDAHMASEDEQETSNHVPGWGSWAGAGLTKSARRAANRARHDPLNKTKVPGTKPQDRKDAKLQNVIISEKSDRKGKKYLTPILPHQFERKEEYERSLRMPLGPEWTTKEVFQRNTRPRVVVKPGSIVDPIAKPTL